MTLQDFLADYDWRAAVNEALGNGYYYNYEDDEKEPFKNFAPGAAREFAENIEHVIACAEGEHDGPEWLALLQMKDGRVAWLRAGCDYTGWDCQAGGSVEYGTLEHFLSPMGMTPGDRERMALSVMAADLKFTKETPSAT